MAEKKVLLTAEVNLTQAIKEMAQYELKVKEIDAASKELTRRMKEEGDESGALRQQLVILGEQRKAYKKEIGELSRGVQNQIVAEEKYKGTLKGLCAQLSTAKDELRAMQTADPGYDKKAKEVDALNEKVKEMEASYGVHTRNVGNYEGAVSSLKDEIKDLLQQMQQLEASGMKGSDTYAQASQKFEAAKEQLGLMNQEVPTLTGSIDKLDISTVAVGAAMGGLQIIKGVFEDGSDEGEKLANIMSKLQVAIIALSTLSKILNTVRQKSLITSTMENLQMKALATSVNLDTAAQSKNIIVKKAATVAQWLLNAAMNANPIVLLVSSIVALGAGLTALVVFLLKSSDAQKAATKSQEDYERAVKKSEAAIAALDAEEARRASLISKQYADELIQMMKNGTSKEAIAKKERQMQDELTQVTIDEAKKRIAEDTKVARAAEGNYVAQRRYLDELIWRKGADSKAAKEQAEKVDEACKTMKSAFASLNNQVKSLNDTIRDQAKTAYDQAQELADKAFDRATKHYDSLAKIQQSALKVASTYLYDSTKTAEENNELKWKSDMEYAARSFQLQQTQERNKLALQRRYGKISTQEYADALKEMEAASTEFSIEQLAQIEEHQRQAVAAIISTAGGKSVDGQIADIKAKYAAARKALKDDATMAADERAFYEYQLAERQAQEIKDVRLRAQEETTKKIKDGIDEQYRYDTRQFSAAATEQIQLEIEKQRQLIEKRKAAGQNTLADERQLAQMEADLRFAQVNKDLQLAWKNADDQYQIKRDYIERELELANLSAEQRAALEEDLANITVENNNRKIASVEEYANQAMEIASAINGLLNAIGDAEVQKAEADNDAKKKALDKRLKAGLITQKQYDKQTAALDEELDAKKAKIAKQQAIREKALGAMQVGINTAMAIMKIWAEVPKFDFGASTIALTALASALGAIQIATILATPIPVARKGGLIEGQTHEQGGVLVNTENDERIISSAPSKAFPELLNLISYIGKHGNVPNTGYAARAIYTGGSTPQSETTNIDYDLLASKIGDKVSDALKALKIYLSLKELRDAEDEQVKIEESAKI